VVFADRSCTLTGGLVQSAGLLRPPMEHLAPFRLKNDQCKLLQCDIMANINSAARKLGSGLDNLEPDHGEHTQIDGPECWVIGRVNCGRECAIGIGIAIGWQYGAFVRRHTADAECPHRHSGIDAKLLSQAWRKWDLEGALGAIYHQGISIHERDRP
jgi:hypothetical protein